MEAALPNFWEQESSSGCPAAPLPFPEFAAAGRKAVVISEAGYMRGPFWVSTPENDKTDKKRDAEIAALKPAARLGFYPSAPTTLMWEVAKNFQGTGETESVSASAVPNTTPAALETTTVRSSPAGEIGLPRHRSPETCRICG